MGLAACQALTGESSAIYLPPVDAAQDPFVQQPLELGAGSAAPATGPAALAAPAGTALPSVTYDPNQVRLQAITPELIAQMRQGPSAASRSAQALMGTAGEYRIGAGDVLGITVWDFPELNQSSGSSTASSDAATAGGSGFLVDRAGYIQFPHIGKFHVAGLTESQAHSRITQALSRVLRNPQLTVRVQNYRSQRVYVDGDVKTPGVYSITDLPMTLPEALNRAGGGNANADLSRLQILRGQRSHTINYPALLASGQNPSQILLAHGDILRVPSRDESKVFVIGEVKRPKSLPLHNGRLSLNAALGEAEGLMPVAAKAKQVYVIRTREDDSGGAPTVFQLDARNPAALILAEQFQLQAQDVVYVDASSLATWNRIISLILPTAALLKSTGDVRDRY